MATFHQGLTPHSWYYSQGCRRPPGSIKFWRIDDALDVLNHNWVQTTKNVFQKCDQLLCSSCEKKVKKIYPLVNHGHPHLHNNHSPNHKPKQKKYFYLNGICSILNSQFKAHLGAFYFFVCHRPKHKHHKYPALPCFLRSQEWKIFFWLFIVLITLYFRKLC